MLQKTKIILWVSLSLIVLDQITKIWVVENICYRGDDLCQEADGAFRVIDHASSSGVDGEIGDIRLDVEDTVVTGHVEAFGTDWPFEGSYEPEGRRIEAKLVDPSGAAFGQITTRKANVSPSGAIWWRSQIEISVGGDTPGEVQSALEESYSLRMDAAGIHVIEGLFQIVHSQNTGAAFGMFTEFKYRMAVFYVFTAFAVWVLWGLYKELEPNDRLGAWIVGLIVAGAIGNLIDRVHKQSVTDFLRVHWGADSWLTGIMRSPEWPSFNVADMAIVGGVGLFAIQYLFYEDKKGDDLEADGEPADMSETAEGDPKAAESEA